MTEQAAAEVFSAANEALVCELVMGDRRHGPRWGPAQTPDAEAANPAGQ